MNDDVLARASASPPQPRPAGPRRRRLHLVLIAILVLLAAFLAPPLVSLGRYKSRITQLIAASLGRPVRLSSVEMRLLPWPGFVLTDLSVAEDPAYGAEPVLHANTVTANIRLLPLWRGKLEIGSISVDEASLNVVRAGPGRWNLDPLFRTAAGQPHSPLRAAALPYLEATDSRINFKNGAEKLPFSLVNTDLSFWQESPGNWRIRLRGQPARTDVSLDLADTGIVRLEASVARAPALHLMPLHADLDWREAQLGQLSRLILGSDPGWRGNLTGELHLDGTPDAARVTTRLLATGVHRAEFAPAAPLDFDANCSFIYHYSRRSLQNLACDSPLGDGRLRLTGDLPGEDAPPNLALELDRIPVAAGLDALRTMRSDIDPDLEAAGTVSGKLAYRGEQEAAQARPARPGAKIRAPRPPRGPLSGSLAVEGFALSGGSLDQPLRAPRFLLEPAPAVPNGGSELPDALAGTMDVPAGGAAPLAANLRLGIRGYQAALRGQVSLARAQALARTFGLTQASALDSLSGEPLAVNLTAEGPWLLPQNAVSFSAPLSAGSAPPQAPPPLLSDVLAGAVTVRQANWSADYLAGRVQIAQATLHIAAGAMRWDPIAFSYGPVKGTASLALPASCAESAAAPPLPPVSPSAPCTPHFQVEFGSLEAAAVQAAFLGARREGTLLSNLLNSLRPASAPSWPPLDGTVKADSFLLGPVTLRQVSATVKISATSADLSALAGSLLGGQMTGSGSVSWAAGAGPQPDYILDAQLNKLNPAAVGQLLAMRWSGGPLSLSGKIELSGFTDKALASSAKGALHFDWRHGSVALPAAAVPASKHANGPADRPAPASPLLAHFDDWSGEATIADGAIALGNNQVLISGAKRTLEGAVTFGKPPKVQLAAGKEAAAKRK